MIYYAIKDRISGLFYNRVHKDLRPLMQNTALYKTINTAQSEIEISKCSRKMGFVQQKILYSNYLLENNIKCCWDYKNIDKYREEHRNDINLEIVQVKLEEV